MKLAGALVALALAGPGATTAAATADSARIPRPGGMLLTLTLGRYVCELPGDANGDTGIHVPEEDFTVLRASTYEAPTGRGAYLFWEHSIEMTSGPKNGARFREVTPNLLRRLNPDGTDSPLRCIRQVLNNRE